MMFMKNLTHCNGVITSDLMVSLKSILLFGLISALLKTNILINILVKPMKFDLSNFMLKLCGFSFFYALLIFLRVKKVSLIVNEKDKNNLLKIYIVRIVAGNNTPQAYGQFRLITAQTEGLLLSGMYK